MVKKITTITILILSITFVSLYIISTTYSLIINVIEKDGVDEIINDITIRDLVTNDDGTFNNTYYDVIRELDINDEEAELIMDSIPLNKVLNIFIESIVDYSIHNKRKLTNDEIYDLIIDGIYSDSNINPGLQNKLINKTKKYINDISKYLYDIKTIKRGVSV